MAWKNQCSFFQGNVRKCSWISGFSHSLSLCELGAIAVLEPDMLMLSNGGPTATVSLAAFQVMLFRVALFYDTLRSHY